LDKNIAAGPGELACGKSFRSTSHMTFCFHQNYTITTYSFEPPIGTEALDGFLAA
jgi:hypothetical protein